MNFKALALLGRVAGVIGESFAQTWRTTTFRLRVSVTFACICAISLATAMLFIYAEMKREKLAYVFDVADLRARLAQSVLQDALFERDQSLTWSANTGLNAREMARPAAMGWPRLPRPDERFLLRTSDKTWNLVRIAPSGGFETAPLPVTDVAGSVSPGETVLSWFRSDGTPIAVRGTPARDVDHKSMNMVLSTASARALSTGLNGGTFTFEDGGRTWVGSFRNVRGTNTFTIGILPVSAAMESSRKAVTRATFIGALVAGTGLLCGLFFVRRAWRPLESIGRVARSIASGDFQVRFVHSFDDEIKALFNALSWMAAALRDRDARVNSTLRSLEHVVEITRAMALATSALSSLKLAAQALVDAGVVSRSGNIAWELAEGRRVSLALPASQALFGEKRAHDSHLSYPQRVLRSIQVIFEDVVVGSLVLSDAAESTAVRHHSPVDAGKVFVDAVVASLIASFDALRRRELDIESKRVALELEAASQIQRSLVSKSMSSAGIHVEALYKPAQKLGGDWFDVVTHGDLSYIYVGDVTGHGIASALLTGIVSGAVQSCHEGMSRSSESPETDAHAEDFLVRMAETLDVIVRANTHQGLCMTLWFGVFDARAAKLTWLNLGHPAAILLSREGPPRLLSSISRPLGGDGPWILRPQTHPVLTDDLVVIYTDGLTENRGPMGERMNSKRLVAELRALSSRDPATATFRLDSVIASTLRDEPPVDDVTAVLFQPRRLKGEK